MKQSKLTLSLTKFELIAGWIYFPCWLLVLPIAIMAVCMIAGVMSDAVVNLIYYAVNALFCVGFFHRLLAQSVRNARHNLKSFGKTVGLGLAGYLAAAYLSGLLILLLKPDFANENDALVLEMVSQFPVLMALSVTVLVPIGEECLFRGLIFVPLVRKNRYLGYAVTILAFSAIHIVGYLGTYDAVDLLICLLQYLPGAAVLCWACEKSDSLVAPMVIHSIINAIGLLLPR